MRFSEKTIEINVCAALSAGWGGDVLWFGLTQAEEAAYGFDSWGEVGGRLVFLQFKAPLPSDEPEIRFRASAEQLRPLLALASEQPGTVYYVLPLLPAAAVRLPAGALLENVWFLDIALLSGLEDEKATEHWIDPEPPLAFIRSKERRVPLASATAVAAADPRRLGVAWPEDPRSGEEIRRLARAALREGAIAAHVGGRSAEA